MQQMRAEPAAQLDASRARRSTRAKVVVAIGPTTMLAGVLWGLLQPYRLTFLHPHGQGFWWLAVEPPLIVERTHIDQIFGLLAEVLKKLP